MRGYEDCRRWAQEGGDCRSTSAVASTQRTAIPGVLDSIFHLHLSVNRASAKSRLQPKVQRRCHWPKSVGVSRVCNREQQPCLQRSIRSSGVSLVTYQGKGERLQDQEAGRALQAHGRCRRDPLLLFMFLRQSSRYCSHNLQPSAI
jgi:hypothetical protein